MDRVTAAIAVFALTILAVAGAIVYFFNLTTLLKLIFGLIFLGALLIFGMFSAITVYARSLKFSAISLIAFLMSGYGLYSVYVWNPAGIGTVIGVFILTLVFFIWYISEPDLSIAERFSSPESLMKKENFRAAGRKFEKKGEYEKAAEAYIKAEMLESAAWAYEKAEKYREAAEIYEILAKKQEDTYYWKEAYEFYKKAGDMRKAAECLEKYAKDEPWFWEDVAEIYEEIGDEEKMREALKEALEYYKKEAEEEGVFWEDVAKLYEKLDEDELAKGAWVNFARYCEKEAEDDPAWYKHVAEAYEKLGLKDRAEEARKKYEEYRKQITTKAE